MKAAITYTCSCGAELLLCVHQNEEPQALAEWRDRLEDVGSSLGLEVVDAPLDEVRCPRCGAPATEPASSVAAVTSR